MADKKPSEFNAKQLDVRGDPKEADAKTQNEAIVPNEHRDRIREAQPVSIKVDSDDQVHMNDGGLDGFEFIYSLLRTTGTRNHRSAYKLIGQVMNISKRDEDSMNASIAMMWDIQPGDSIEGMLAAQMTAVHNMSMEMARRAMHREQTFEGVQEGVNSVTKLMRTFALQVDSLKKYRTGGKQTIQVQHVNVNNGGQAIVGNIKGGGGNG